MYKNQTKNVTSLIFLGLLAVILIITSVKVVSAQNTRPIPKSPPPGSTMEQRLNQRKAEQNVVLAPAEDKRLIGVCANVQTKLRDVQQKATAANDKRVKVNQQVDGKIWVAIGKLKIAQKDTFDLEQQRNGLATKISTTQRLATEYSQSLDDAMAINCKADVVGFKAMIETSRAYREQLRLGLTDMRNYINNDVKNSLDRYASDLQTKTTTSGEED